MTGSMALPSLMTTLIPWAISSVLLILAVLAVRRLTRDRLSSVNRYALWLVVLIRLLVPIQFPFLSSLGAVDLAPQMENTPVYAFPTGHIDAPERYIQHIREEQGEDPVMSAGVTSRSFPALGGIGFDYYNGGTILEENGYTDYAFFSTVPRILSILWGAGALVMLLCLIGSNLRFAARLRRSRRPLNIPQCPLPVYRMEGLSSPCLFGLFHPAIYLTPEAAENETALRHVLAHEGTHYAHKDHIWSALRCTALALHWYDPLVWLAVSLSKADGELACDEGAVRRLGEEERIPYGRTLVDMVAQRSLRPADLLSCSTTMAGGGKCIQQRVALLVKKPETRATAIFGACTALALAAVFTFGGSVSSPYNSVMDDAVLYELGDGLTLAIPANISEELLVEFPDDEQQEPNFPYVYHRASYEAGLEDFGTPAGFLFNLFRYDQVEYEQSYLAADGGTGQIIFARDDQWYYGMGVPTDLQFYTGSDEIDFNSPEYQHWEHILSRITDIQVDFTARNGLTLYDASADLNQPFLWAGEHRYVECRNADGTIFLTLLLSQPAKQGDGGIWCVEGSFEHKYGLWNRELPAGIQVSAAAYYENLQAKVDTGYRPELLDPVQAATDWHRAKYNTEDLSGITFTLLESEPTGDLQGTSHPVIPQENSVPLTPEELAYFNDGSFFDNGTGNGGDAYLHFSIRNMFLTSQYDTPQDIDLFELFYCGSAQPSTPMSQEERQLVIDRGYGGTDPDCGCTKITRQEMDAVLLEHTGLTLEETRQVGLEQFTYLPEYDAYYHFHGDTNYTFPIFSQGSRQGDLLHLDYGDRRLTLRQTGNSYQFYSNRSLTAFPE